jgi:hypothetical protein
MVLKKKKRLNELKILGKKKKKVIPDPPQIEEQPVALATIIRSP